MYDEDDDDYAADESNGDDDYDNEEYNEDDGGNGSSGLKRKKNNKLIKLLLKCWPIVLILVLILSGVAGGAALKDIFNDSESKNLVNREDYATEEEYIIALLELKHTVKKDINGKLQKVEEYIYNNEDLGNTYMTREDFKTFLQAVADAKTPKTKTITYKYKVEIYTEDYDEVRADEPIMNDEGLLEYPTEKVYKGTFSLDDTKYRKDSKEFNSNDIEYLYQPNWQPIYAMYCAASLNVNEDWLTRYEDESQNSLVEMSRINMATLNKIISLFVYDYDYLWDGARSTSNNFSYEDLENISYKYSEKRVDIDEHTYEIIYTKEPMTSLAFISNSYTYFKIHYNGRDAASYTGEINANSFFIGGYNLNHEFSFDWYIAILEQLPNSSEYVDFFTGIMEQYDSGNYFYTFGGELPYAGFSETWHIGDGLCDLDTHGDIILPYQPGSEYTYDVAGAGLTLMRKDGVTLEQFRIIVKKWCTELNSYPNSLFLAAGCADAFWYAQEEYGISCFGMLALASHESAFGTSAIARAKNNFFGWGAYDKDPMGNAIPYATPAEGVSRIISGIYNGYMCNGQDTFYKMRFNGGVHQYCTDDWSVWGVKCVTNRQRIMELADSLGYDLGYDIHLIGDGDGSLIAQGALSAVGGTYVWGGSDLATGVDCSGLVMYLYRSLLGIDLPHSSKAQSKLGKGVNPTLEDLRPGDLIFYGPNNNVTHVTIYVGDGICVSASSEKVGIVTRKYNYRNIICARRIIS